MIKKALGLVNFITLFVVVLLGVNYVMDGNTYNAKAQTLNSSNLVISDTGKTVTVSAVAIDTNTPIQGDVRGLFSSDSWEELGRITSPNGEFTISGLADGIYHFHMLPPLESDYLDIGLTIEISGEIIKINNVVYDSGNAIFKFAKTKAKGYATKPDGTNEANTYLATYVDYKKISNFRETGYSGGAGYKLIADGYGTISYFAYDRVSEEFGFSDRVDITINQDGTYVYNNTVYTANQVQHIDLPLQVLQFKGKVLASNGSTLEGNSYVTIKNSSGQVVKRYYLNSCFSFNGVRGNFFIGGLPNGTYSLFAESAFGTPQLFSSIKQLKVEGETITVDGVAYTKTTDIDLCLTQTQATTVSAIEFKKGVNLSKTQDGFNVKIDKVQLPQELSSFAKLGIAGVSDISSSGIISLIQNTETNLNGVSNYDEQNGTNSSNSLADLNNVVLLLNSSNKVIGYYIIPKGYVITDTQVNTEADFTFDATTGKIAKYVGTVKNVVIPSKIAGVDVKVIGSSAFEFASIDSVVIPNTVNSIENNAFIYSTLKSVSIPDGVLSIGENAFWNCRLLSTVDISKSVNYIGPSAFGVCTTLSAINVDPLNTAFCSEAGVLFNKDKTTLLQYTIGSNNSSYIIPDSVTNIGTSAFSNDKSLTSISISSHVATIEWYAFSGCRSLQEIIVDFYNPYYKSSDGVLFNSEMTELIQFPGNKGGEYAIPGTVKELRVHSFLDCKNLTSVTIPYGVKTIYYVFWGCSNLRSVTLPNSITEIKNYAFGYCPISSIKIPYSVTSIEQFAFMGCSSLSSVYFYGNAPTMGSDVFVNAKPDFKAYYLAGNSGYSENWYGYSATTFEAQVIGIYLSKVYLELQEGNSEQLNAWAIPDETSVSWSVVSGTTVAAISKTGVVAALSEGIATVRATSIADSSKYAECTVVVNQVITKTVTGAALAIDTNMPVEGTSQVYLYTQGWDFLRTMPVDANGKFTVEGLTNGEYHLKVIPPDNSDYLWIPLDVTVTESAITINNQEYNPNSSTYYFTKTKARGTVKNSNGELVIFANIKSFIDSTKASDFTRTGSSNQFGSYKLVSEGYGELSYYAYDQSGIYGFSDRINLAINQDGSYSYNNTQYSAYSVQTINLTLPVLQFKGMVYNGTENTVNCNALVTIKNTSGQIVKRYQLFGTASNTSLNGAFLIGGLPDGRYTIKAEYHGTKELASETKVIDISGSTITVDYHAYSPYTYIDLILTDAQSVTCSAIEINTGISLSKKETGFNVKIDRSKLPQDASLFTQVSVSGISDASYAGIRNLIQVIEGNLAGVHSYDELNGYNSNNSTADFNNIILLLNNSNKVIGYHIIPKGYTYVTEVKLNNSAITLNVGGKWQLNATVGPEAVLDKSVTWSVVQGASVVSVSETGQVNATSTGSAIVRATSTADTSKYADCAVTVKTIDECFIATAAFGSKLQPAVALLRQFRDKCLLTNSLGRKFVEFYYKNSPPIANFIATNGIMKTIVRVLLTPLILLAFVALNPLKGMAAILAIMMLLGALRKRRSENMI